MRRVAASILWQPEHESQIVKERLAVIRGALIRLTREFAKLRALKTIVSYHNDAQKQGEQ